MGLNWWLSLVPFLTLGGLSWTLDIMEIFSDACDFCYFCYRQSGGGVRLLSGIGIDRRKKGVWGKGGLNVKVTPAGDKWSSGLAQPESTVLWDLTWLLCGLRQAGGRNLGGSVGGVWVISRFD